MSQVLPELLLTTTASISSDLHEKDKDHMTSLRMYFDKHVVEEEGGCGVC